MPFIPTLPKSASLLNVFQMFPETSKPLIEFHEVLLRGPSPFTEAERELIAAYVSGLNQCDYCQGVHTATAELLGVSGDSVSGAIDDIDAAPIATKIKPILRYARKLTQQPNSVTRADADAIFAAGWDATALYHT
ncbi:MAG: carboxymuconolactone decarboxylase family protein, partial [Bryobacteraceae bacterium]